MPRALMRGNDLGVQLLQDAQAQVVFACSKCVPSNLAPHISSICPPITMHVQEEGRGVHACSYTERAC